MHDERAKTVAKLKATNHWTTLVCVTLAIILAMVVSMHFYVEGSPILDTMLVITGLVGTMSHLLWNYWENVKLLKYLKEHKPDECTHQV